MDSTDLIREGRIPRFFRATRKLNAPNFVSHITQRAAGKEPLFLEESDYLTMLGLLKDTSDVYSLEIFAFCFMPNHLHLLFSPREKNLYDAMRSLFSRYAMRFNKKYERKGHLFGGPYRQAVCLDDTYLLAASLYIHQNPVRAGLTADTVDYRWSSCRLYCKRNISKSFVNTDFILSLLPKEGISKRERYKELLKHGDGSETREVLEAEDVIERYRSRLVSMFPKLFNAIRRRKQISQFSGIELLGIEELEELAEAVRTRSLPSKPESRKAKKHAIEQLVARGYKRAEIAERLGFSRKTVYNILKTSS
jgi:putative transposase